MIIAKPEWFSRRKYGGWGVNIKTWQGAVYLICVLSILVLIQTLPFWNTTQRLIITGGWLTFLFLDLVDVMWKLKKDERERMHEAIAERNAAWGMMLVLVIGVLIELLYYGLHHKLYVDPFLIGALIIGVIIKAVRNYWLGKHD